MFMPKLFADAAASGEFRITGTMVLIGALALVAGYFGLSVLRAKRIEVEGRAIDFKRDCQSAAGFFQKIGLPHSAAFWNALALEDFPTAKKEVHAVLTIFKSDTQRTAALAEVIDTYIVEIKKDQDDDEVARLQKMLGGTAADASAAAAAGPSADQLAKLAGMFNPVAAGAQRIVHQPQAVVLQPPALVTDLTHSLVQAGAAAAPAVGAAIQAAVAMPKI